MAKKVVEQRVPDDEQPVALSIAEEAGVLPDADRREEPADTLIITDAGAVTIRVVRDLSAAHQRIVNPDGTVSYFTESGDLL